MVYGNPTLGGCMDGDMPDLITVEELKACGFEDEQIRNIVRNLIPILIFKQVSYYLAEEIRALYPISSAHLKAE